MRENRRALFVVGVFVLGCLLGRVAEWFSSPAFAFPVIDPNDSTVHDSAGYPSWGADSEIAVTGTATTSGSAALAKGFYIIVCEENTHADQGATGVVATTAERYIPKGSPYPLRVTGVSDTYISWIQDTTSGSCFLSRDDF